jgi:hypothetical protein
MATFVTKTGVELIYRRVYESGFGDEPGLGRNPKGSKREDTFLNQMLRIKTMHQLGYNIYLDFFCHWQIIYLFPMVWPRSAFLYSLMKPLHGARSCTRG